MEPASDDRDDAVRGPFARYLQADRIYSDQNGNYAGKNLDAWDFYEPAIFSSKDAARNTIEMEQLPLTTPMNTRRPNRALQHLTAPAVKPPSAVAGTPSVGQVKKSPREREIEAMNKTDRRWFLRCIGKSAALALSPALFHRLAVAKKPDGSPEGASFKTRGVVLVTKDLKEVGWPQIAKDAGLSTIGTHITPSEVVEFVRSEKGQRFLDECKQFDIQVEHELHAMNDLLPRALFSKNPEMFRMNPDGKRVGDFNCCVHSKEGIEVICEKAVEYGKILRPTTGRYFYWMDDGRPMCKCSKCRVYSDSDQALILENAIVKVLRKEDPSASLAHLAYGGTLAPPTQVKPEPGIFLEFAPINRSWAHSLNQSEIAGTGSTPNGKILEYLDANLEVFPRDTAQVLEYWLDVSMFSKWKRPAKRLPWNPDVFRSDLDTYAKRGIQHVTTFAAWIDGEYVKRFGHPDFVKEYGGILLAHGKVAEK